MRVLNDKILDLSSITASSESETIEISHITGFNIYISWVEDVVVLDGNLKLQARVHEDAPFFDIPSTLIALGGTSNFSWNVADSFYKDVKILITIISGTASLEAWMIGKGL